MTSAELQYLLAVLADREGDSPDALAELEAAATQDDIPVLRAAIEADSYLGERVGPLIGRIEGVSALPFLLRTLRRTEEDGNERDDLTGAITELLDQNTEEAVSVLGELSRSDTAGHRRDAAWLWGYVADSAALGPLLALSRDPDPHVASHALGSLSSHKGREEVFERLTEALPEEDEYIRISTIRALGYFDDPRAIPLLESFVDDDSHAVRSVARYALRQLGAS